MTASKQMNLAMLERQRFIDAMLDYYGALNRSVLMDYFGISQAQASSDLSTYFDQAPENVRYDHCQKKFLRMDSFRRVYP